MSDNRYHNCCLSTPEDRRLVVGHAAAYARQVLSLSAGRRQRALIHAIEVAERAAWTARTAAWAAACADRVATRSATAERAAEAARDAAEATRDAAWQVSWPAEVRWANTESAADRAADAAARAARVARAAVDDSLAASAEAAKSASRPDLLQRIKTLRAEWV